jgi:hypothetical protein
MTRCTRRNAQVKILTTARAGTKLTLHYTEARGKSESNYYSTSAFLALNPEHFKTPTSVFSGEKIANLETQKHIPLLGFLIFSA